jgi:hypothetical protein
MIFCAIFRACGSFPYSSSTLAMSIAPLVMRNHAAMKSLSASPVSGMSLFCIVTALHEAITQAFGAHRVTPGAM